MMKREPRWWFVAYAVGLGAVVAIAAWRGGNEVMAAGSLPFFALFGLAMAFTPWGVLRERSQDEREQVIGRQAALVSYNAVVLTVVTGFLVQLARGENTHPWSFIGFVGGTSFLVALAVLSRRG